MLDTDMNQLKNPPKLFAWFASGATIFVIILAQFLPQNGNPYLRGTGVLILLLAGIFIFAPFYLLTKYGGRKDRKTYMQSGIVVDQGLYAITRHPQYLGYIFLACGFTLLSGHWATALLAFTGISFFHIQVTREEAYCLAQFGEPYAEYLQRVPRYNIILGIWRVLRSS